MLASQMPAPIAILLNSICPPSLQPNATLLPKESDSPKIFPKESELSVHWSLTESSASSFDTHHFLPLIVICTYVLALIDNKHSKGRDHLLIFIAQSMHAADTQITQGLLMESMSTRHKQKQRLQTRKVEWSWGFEATCGVTHPWKDQRQVSS